MAHSLSLVRRHCDLKPDNVLINIFPDDVVHLKIGRNRFRSGYFLALEMPEVDLL